MIVTAKTLATELVAVKPMSAPYGIPQDILNEVNKRLEIENRECKIDSIINSVEFIEKKLELDEEYINLLEEYGSNSLFYVDYTYDNV